MTLPISFEQLLTPFIAPNPVGMTANAVSNMNNQRSNAEQGREHNMTEGRLRAKDAWEEDKDARDFQEKMREISAALQERHGLARRLMGDEIANKIFDPVHELLGQHQVSVADPTSPDYAYQAPAYGQNGDAPALGGPEQTEPQKTTPEQIPERQPATIAMTQSPGHEAQQRPGESPTDYMLRSMTEQRMMPPQEDADLATLEAAQKARGDLGAEEPGAGVPEAKPGENDVAFAKRLEAEGKTRMAKGQQAPAPEPELPNELPGVAAGKEAPGARVIQTPTRKAWADANGHILATEAPAPKGEAAALVKSLTASGLSPQEKQIIGETLANAEANGWGVERTLQAFHDDVMPRLGGLQRLEAAKANHKGGGGQRTDVLDFEAGRKAVATALNNPATKAALEAYDSVEKTLDMVDNPKTQGSVSDSVLQRTVGLMLNKGAFSEADAHAPEQYYSLLDRAALWASKNFSGRLDPQERAELIEVLRSARAHIERTIQDSYESDLTALEQQGPNSAGNEYQRGWANGMFQEPHYRKGAFFDPDRVNRIAGLRPGHAPLPVPAPRQRPPALDKEP